MKYLDEFRSGAAARNLSQALHSEIQADRYYRFMEFCGGHTHTIFKYGLLDIFPKAIRMVHGPGCPVCVLPVGRLDMALSLAQQPGVIFCSYGDTLRVPGSNRFSLLSARAAGADIRMVHSAADALRFAQENANRQVVFFAIGFETTTPPTALILLEAKKLGLKNFSIFCNHVLTPAAIQGILATAQDEASGGVSIDGFIGPGHVSTVIGTKPYEPFAEKYHRPIVISGFEPLDVLQSVLMLVRQVNKQRCEVENQYSRVVSKDGNPRAIEVMARVFELRQSFAWRGLGRLPYSAVRIKPEYSEFDAEVRFSMKEIDAPDHPGCLCASVLRGLINPPECPLFGKACTPQSPVGSCMVSSEGACAAHYQYRT